MDNFEFHMTRLQQLYAEMLKGTAREQSLAQNLLGPTIEGMKRYEKRTLEKLAQILQAATNTER